MDNNELQSINKMLKVMVALMLERKEETKNKLREQIQALDNLGLKPPEIAAILNRSGIYVRKELSGIRKHKKGKKQS